MDFTLTDMPMYYAGGGFPWGFLIIGGIIFLLWKNGMFDRFGNGGRFGGYGPGYGPGPGAGPTQGGGYGAGQGSYGDPRDPRALFEEWHRQAHATGVDHGHPAAPAAPAAPPTPATEAQAFSPETPRSGEGDRPANL